MVDMKQTKDKLTDTANLLDQMVSTGVKLHEKLQVLARKDEKKADDKNAKRDLIRSLAKASKKEKKKRKRSKSREDKKKKAKKDKKKTAH
jgi:hypothetical protein